MIIISLLLFVDTYNSSSEDTLSQYSTCSITRFIIQELFLQEVVEVSDSEGVA